jgi:hypothetical protein
MSGGRLVRRSKSQWYMTLQDFLNKINRFDLTDNGKAVLEDNSDDYIEFNRVQMRAGITSGGNPIRPEYTERYAKFKQSYGSKSPYGTPDLLLTGTFQQSMSFDADFKITGATDYSDYLEARYKDIYGLTDDNTLKFRHTILFPEFKKIWQNV